VHRFFLAPADCHGESLVLGERDSHHAVRVLRLAQGDPIEVLDGAGQRLQARVVRADRWALRAVVEQRSRCPAPPPVALAPAVLKGRAMDLLIQKATELGATRISPVITDRTIVHVDADGASGKAEGWLDTAVEACKQCGNPWLPRIDAPQPLARFLAERPPGLGMVASLDPAAPLAGAVLDACGASAAGVVLVTGPEGDFAPDEERAVRAAGVRPFTLGPLVLRAETAALAALAVLQHELRRRGWM
jgi:16S rRNA (uracil1498-N3)-methyltransferase